MKIKEKIILQKHEIRQAQSNYPNEKRLIKELKRQLRELKSDFSIVLEFISVTRRCFEDNTKNLPLGDWKGLILDAFKGSEFTRDEKINFLDSFGQK